MSRRTLAAWISTMMLVGIIVISYGLDWRAALWAEYGQEPAPPADGTTVWVRCDGAGQPRC